MEETRAIDRVSNRIPSISRYNMEGVEQFLYYMIFIDEKCLEYV